MSATTVQLVTFQLGGETYGIDIMDVEGIVQVEEVRPSPHAPEYVEGIFNLRGEIIPVINLRKRFNLRSVDLSEDDKLLSGFVIVNVQDTHLAIMIDRVQRVVTVPQETVQKPPQMMSGIGNEYIRGVVPQESAYLIILNVNRIFDVRELRALEQVGR